MPDHAIVHVDIPAADPAAAGKFYSDLFGWEALYDAGSDYHMFRGGAGPGGGFIKQAGAAPSGGVLIYVGTDDIDAMLARAVELGGTVVGGKIDMGGNGAYATFADPSGNHIGLYTGPNVAAYTADAAAANDAP
ncbi:MAG: VOC family protein [Chloroflexota bacterium]|nr:VOC family protein [Chloroflexota bacterium]